MFVNQKVKEISSAIVKIAAYVRRPELKNRLEKLSFQLLEEVLSRQYEQAAGFIAVLTGVVELAKNIYEIDPANATIIIHQLGILDSAIRQVTGLEQSPNLENEFSKVPEVIKSQDNQIDSNNGNGNGNGNSAINMAIRQSAIIEKIRQSGKIALKDIIAEFPEVSERTIRYDLQKLCNQGLAERIGNGGPATYYTAKANL